MRVLIFGDSITQGLWDTQGGWAQRLVSDSFTEQMKDYDADVPYVFNLGFAGDVTKHLTERLPHETEARFSLWSGDQDMTFVIAIGINDSHVIAGKPFSSPEQYTKDLTVLLETARRYSKKILFVGLTPVEDDHPYVKDGRHVYATERIREFEQALRDFVTEHDVAFVPLFEELRDGIAAGKELFADGLHPNDAGHQLIYERVKPALDALLKNH